MTNDPTRRDGRTGALVPRPPCPLCQGNGDDHVMALSVEDLSTFVCCNCEGKYDAAEMAEWGRRWIAAAEWADRVRRLGKGPLGGPH